MEGKFFERLKQSLKEAVAHDQGKIKLETTIVETTMDTRRAEKVAVYCAHHGISENFYYTGPKTEGFNWDSMVNLHIKALNEVGYGIDTLVIHDDSHGFEQVGKRTYLTTTRESSKSDRHITLCTEYEDLNGNLLIKTCTGRRIEYSDPYDSKLPRYRWCK